MLLGVAPAGCLMIGVTLLTPRNLAALLSLTLLAAGCQCAPKPGPFDAGEKDGGPTTKPDAGPMNDGGPDIDPDGGLFYPSFTAAEPCPPGSDTLEVQDTDGGIIDGGELPDGGFVVWGLCAALRNFDGTATLNGQGATGINLRFESGDYKAEAEPATDAFGKFHLKVLKGRYDLLKYHPAGVFSTHQGHEEFGNIDLNKDQSRDLAVRSHVLRGGAIFANLPFLPQQSPPDLAIEAPGFPPTQLVSTTSVGGGYEVNLLEGVFGIYLNVEPKALGGTQLVRYPMTTSLNFSADSVFDINIDAHEVEGEVKIDGAPIPDRQPGEDFTLEYTPTGGSSPVAITHHEGGLSNIHSLIPSGKYTVNLNMESKPDRSLPSRIYGKQVSPQLDLTNQNQQLNVDMKTFKIEGGILIDGQPPKYSVSDYFTLYMLALPDALYPSNLLYFEVPLDSGTFELKAFPANYYALLALDNSLADDLAAGWFLINKYFQVQSDTKLPIVVETAVLDGKITIDGKPPPGGKPVGQFTFQSRTVTQSSFFYRTVTPAEDGSFRVRVPKGSYEVNFYIDNHTFPEYASGRYRMVSRLDLDHPQTLNFDYKSVLVTGPIRVGGRLVENNTGGPEVGLNLRRMQDGTDWDWNQEGGSTHYRMRIPDGDYMMWFKLNRDAYPDTAWGNAPMGVRLPVHLPMPAASK